MIYTDVLIIGGGPAGMAAAVKSAASGAKVLLVERDYQLGGQLIKQTHRFFGSKNEFAGTRGISIAREFEKEISTNSNIEVMLGATAQGYYEDEVLTLSHEGKFKKIKAGRIIIATGASEKMLPFINNDLPGVYGAGAVQTLMNLYGIIPGKKVLMVGAGNIGLIVSYQLLQAGVEVSAIVEAAPKIGGYLVHASKVRRAGIPIFTGYSIKKAVGRDSVEKAVIWKLDENWNPVSGTEKTLNVDTICLAVGLRPLTDLLIQAGCRMAYVPQLGGDVPVRNDNLQTTNERFYVAGDAAGVEEATAAILEGELAGLSASADLGFVEDNHQNNIKQVKEQLKGLRKGPVGEKIRSGLKMVRGDENAGKDRYSYR